MLRWSLALSLALLTASVVHAGVLAPQRASDVVRVEGGLVSGDCSPSLAGGGREFDTILRPDGTTEPLEIPAKRVLVVTDVEVLGFGGSTGSNDQLRLFVGTLATGMQVVARREQRFDADGRVFYVLAFNPGLIVPSGGRICMNDSDNVTLTGFLTGYFGKGK